MNELYTGLVAYINALTGVTVIRANQSAPAPAPPYITINIQSQPVTGSFRTAIDEDGEQSVTRTFAFILDINFYGAKNGQAALEALVYAFMDKMEDHTARLLAIPGVALQEIVQPPTDVAALFGEQWQPRYNVAIRFHTSRNIVYTNSTIDTVQLERTMEAP
jgi:hypothetical protein